MDNKHNDAPAYRRIAGRLGLALGVLALATGCESIERADRFLDRHWIVQSHMHSPENVAIAVRNAETSTAVTFAPRAAALGADQRDLLARFVAGSGASRGDRAVIALSPAPNRALAERRVRFIARELHRHGLAVTRSFGPGESDAATITINRTVAMAPNCPEWSNFMKRNEVDEHGPKFGCLTSSSLAATVNRPNDLLYGRPTGPSDGPTMDRGIQLLREGKLDTPLTGTGTGTQQGK